MTGLVGDTTSTTCNGSNPATIQVRIPNNQIQSAPIGNYADTLTVVITPQAS
jgi:spore coat protein U-like protein